VTSANALAAGQNTKLLYSGTGQGKTDENERLWPIKLAHTGENEIDVQNEVLAKRRTLWYKEFVRWWPLGHICQSRELAIALR
jgi:hypothetical protein